MTTHRNKSIAELLSDFDYACNVRRDLVSTLRRELERRLANGEMAIAVLRQITDGASPCWLDDEDIGFTARSEIDHRHLDAAVSVIDNS